MVKYSLDSYNDKNLDKSTGFVNCKKGWTRLVAASDKVSVAGPWSVVLSGYSASSTTKTGRHDIAEILLKVALNTINKSINRLDTSKPFYAEPPCDHLLSSE